MNITVLADENIPGVEHYLGPRVTVRYVNGRALRKAQLRGVDALLVRSVTRVDETLLAGSSIQYVGTTTSGVDHIDQNYLSRCGIAFAHAPGSNANSVVEYVLTAIAAAGQKLENILDGARVGIVGYGVIGRALAARLKALGVRYSVFDPWLDQSAIPSGAELSAVLDCDVVSLHAELTHHQPWPSMHLLADAELKCMRTGSLLINASRGPVVDNKALLTLLQTRDDLSVVLDVWEGEPDITSGLLERVALGSAHIAGYSLDGKIQATRIVSEALCNHFAVAQPTGESPLADPPAVNAPANLSDAELVRHLLQSRYDIFEDDGLLRQAVLHNKSSASPEQGFDLLRKQYRVRRELAGAAVEGAALSHPQLQLIRALGCVYERQGSLQ